MFSRALFRTGLRTAPAKCTRLSRPAAVPPVFPSTIRPLNRALSQTTRRTARYPIQPRRPPSSGGWEPPNYHEEVRRAKPLITPQQLNRVASGQQTRWIAVLAVAGGTVFYFSNLETVEASGRQIFNCYSEESVEAEGERAYHMIMREARGSILPAWDPRTKMVERVMNRLIQAADLHHVDWTVHVIHGDEANAFVIPGGKVFVYTGILPIAKTDDGLAAILGHEIAHNLAKHQAEKMSQMVLLEPLRWAFISLDWALGGIAISQVLGAFALDLGLMRPAGRKQESEADYIGLMMMAKSCYDPMEAVHVWERMEASNRQSLPEYLSTHPSNQNRIAHMTKWLNAAQKAREENGCAAIVPQIEAFRPVMKRTLDMFR